MAEFNDRPVVIALRHFVDVLVKLCPRVVVLLCLLPQSVVDSH